MVQAIGRRRGQVTQATDELRRRPQADMWESYQRLFDAARRRGAKIVDDVYRHPELGQGLRRLELEFMILPNAEQRVLLSRMASHARVQGQAGNAGPLDLWGVFRGANNVGDCNRTDLVGRKVERVDFWRDLMY